MAGRKRIALISTGGTIVSRRSESGGAVPAMDADQLVAAVPVIGTLAEIESTTVQTIASKEMTISDVVGLAREILAKSAADFDGVVVVQGTDTLEETAFAVDLLVDAAIPVVFTAAMRHPDMLGSDGPPNLVNAIRVAASDAARGIGTVVVLNDTIHAARFVQKLHTSSLGAFQSPSLGPLGGVYEGHVRIGLAPRTHPLVAFPTKAVPPVALVTAAIGDQAPWLAALLDDGYKGIVMEGFGGGHLPAGVVDNLTRIMAEVPVVISSRTGTGPILRETYGTVGGDIDLAERGLLSAGFLDGPKARILLSLLLAGSGDRIQVSGDFAEIVSAL